jgi:hypothetical protein
MNKILFSILFVCLSTFSIKSFSTGKLLSTSSRNLLIGTWGLSEIESKDSLTVYKSNERLESTEDAKKKSAEVVLKIPMKKVMEKELKIGITKFIFSDQTYEFYRDSKITFSGSWNLNDQTNQLILHFGKGEDEHTKENKIIKLTDNLFVIESESHNKKITLTFIKK